MQSGRRAATLPVSFFRRDVIDVARGLLGRTLVVDYRRGRTRSRIVEVEAYLGAIDAASHAYRYRRHAQNQSLYLPAGTWYIYLSYGVHWCANLVAGAPGEGAAVLLRAVEPLDGLELMRRRRRLDQDRLLCSGPGRLTQALGMTRAGLDGVAMAASRARILDDAPVSDADIVATRRIGITQAAELPLRFNVKDSPWISGPRGWGKEKGRP
jgi:DNA-3-methyladenine glycosylase